MFRCAPSYDGAPAALVTGATSGGSLQPCILKHTAQSTVLLPFVHARAVGFEACRQLALSKLPYIGRIILACRNEEKAKATIDRLVELTERDAKTFEILLLDMLELSSVRAAVKAVRLRSPLCC